ncbi:hypothetical protein FA13DRAFT_868169 [Coprinellus micaceus]|uniref:Uncharacterized protein n=1 Tax=Coprinellus micaceus TaxID=71717 RepID=A0A4Y7S0W3_COPMI|nr:hypothetical protein FA13DRAFT_868169 [Coprinellus micaceus]
MDPDQGAPMPTCPPRRSPPTPPPILPVSFDRQAKRCPRSSGEYTRSWTPAYASHLEIDRATRGLSSVPPSQTPLRQPPPVSLSLTAYQDRLYPKTPPRFRFLRTARYGIHAWPWLRVAPSFSSTISNDHRPPTATYPSCTAPAPAYPARPSA